MLEWQALSVVLLSAGVAWLPVALFLGLGGGDILDVVALMLFIPVLRIPAIIAKMLTV